jgi:esterase/lipase
MSTKSIVFIHGMYMIPLSWEKWIPYFENKGYKCYAPSWPGRDQPIEILRQKCLDPELGELTLTGVVENLTEFI